MRRRLLKMARVKRFIDAVSALARMGSSGIFGGQFCQTVLGFGLLGVYLVTTGSWSRCMAVPHDGGPVWLWHAHLARDSRARRPYHSFKMTHYLPHEELDP